MKAKPLFIIFFLICSCLTLRAQKDVRRNFCSELSLHYGYEDCYAYRDHYSLTAVYGYNIKDRLRIGVGTGFEYSPFRKDENAVIDGDNKSYIPVFAEVKYSFLPKEVSPYTKLRGGTNIALDGHLGYKIHPEVGLDLKRFSVGIGLDYNELFYEKITLKYTTVNFCISYRF